MDPESPPRAARRFYYPQLDTLRFLAFAGVFADHAYFETAGQWTARPAWYTPDWWIGSALISGAFGVDLFFVLSSFLITSLLIQEIDTRGRLDVRAFWIRRLLRIWPLYFSFLLVAGLIQHVPWQSLILFGLFAGNWAALWYDSHPFVIGPLWSVSVEEQFYFAWPLVLALVPRRRLPWVCVGLVACSLAVRSALLALGGTHHTIWVNTFARLDPIAIGALLGLGWHARHIELGAAARWALAAGGVVATVLSVGWLAYVLPHPPLPVSTPRGIVVIHFLSALLIYPVVAVACGAIILAFLTGHASRLAHPVLVYLGRISYGLYVFHLAALRTVPSLWWPWRLALAFLLTLLAAALSYRLLEQPFLRLKDRFAHVRSGAPQAVAAPASAEPTLSSSA